MKSMNRQFGKLMKKGAGDQANVAVLLKDYEDADKMLAKIIEASKAWRDAWVSILNTQVAQISTFEEIYNPIVGATDGHGHEPAETPREQIDRVSKLQVIYTELKTDLLEEVSMMDARVIKPATDAKEYLVPIRKTIKKRDNKRLDWEQCQDKVTNYNKKMKRTDRENAALAKAEEELARASEAFKVADDHLRETLPPIIAAAFSILPHLLAVQIMIQNTLLAQYYTSLHNYCEETGFQSPPPPMEEVISTWQRDFKPVQQEAEKINCIARGKAVHQPMNQEERRPSSSVTGVGIRNGISSRRPSGQAVIGANPETRVLRIPSSNSLAVATPSAASPSPSAEFRNTDYFQSAAIQKKKPPPPPPKRINSQALYAIALYSFDGQNDGDLSFREGDQIKVVKKTDSTDDWWQGELRGTRGSFPANYCKLA